MAGQIEALMGLVPPEQADQQALARQLRSDRNLGQFFQGSGSQRVRDAGAQMTSDAMTSAKGAGTRREQALGRSVAAEKEQYQRGRDTQKDTLAATALSRTNRLKDEQLALEAGEYTDPTQMRDRDGKIAWYGYKGGTGPLVKIPDSEGLSEANTTGAAKRVTIDGTNISYLRYPDGTIVYNQQEYPDINAFREANKDIIAQGAKSQAEIKGAVTTAGEWAKLDAEEVNDKIRGVADLDSVYGDSMRNIDVMVKAIDDGAETGQIYSMFTTLTDATSRFESAKAKETLNMLAQYKLTPVSDRDLAELNKAAQPNMTPEDMRAWLIHKREGVERMQKANRKMEDFLRKKRTIPTGEERDLLEAEVDAILHDGYDFAFSGGNAEQGGGIPRNDYGMTEDEWNGLTDDQKLQLEG